MRVRLAEAFLVRLPLRLTVRHALAARRESVNLVVRLRDAAGREGWGEGVPRDYVTGEDPAASFTHLVDELLPALVGAEIGGPEELLPLLARRLPISTGTQTACCATELALLDLAGKAFGRSAAAWFGPLHRETVRYSLVLPLLDPASAAAFLAGARQLGIAHLKVKADGERWQEALAEARRVLGDAVTIAVDANGSWDVERAAAHLREMERFGVAWVEQPLPRGQEAAIPLLAAGTPIPLMADESLTTVGEAVQLGRTGGYRFFNLRVSKLGGLVASHEIARVAEQSGIRVQVGCQVGESSLLSAAGRLLAAMLPATAALEGSYGSRLLESDVTDDPFEFGAGGLAAVQRGPGLGVAVAPERVEALAVRRAAVS